MKEIKGSHILVLGSGSSMKRYKDEIAKFIIEARVVTFGCNNIMDFLVPDYHFWGSEKRWKEFAHLISPKTTVVTSQHFPSKVIRSKWKGEYKTFKNAARMWKYGSDDKGSDLSKRCRVCYRNKKMFGCVRNISTWAIFYAYIKGASKISVVGNDGYTLYFKKDLEEEKYNQHCYGSGMTDGFSYAYCRKKDWDKYKTLRLLRKYGEKEYGFGFEFITPTIFDEFYNHDILKIRESADWNKWEEPTKKEYRKLYSIKGVKKISG